MKRRRLIDYFEYTWGGQRSPVKPRLPFDQDISGVRKRDQQQTNYYHLSKYGKISSSFRWRRRKQGYP